MNENKTNINWLVLMVKLLTLLYMMIQLLRRNYEI